MKYLYICHYCVEYKTESLSDMIKHYKRKTQCKCSTIFSYEDSNILSRKKYIFNFDIKNLTYDDYLYIITHYNEDYNEINKDFKKNKTFINENQNNKDNINNIFLNKIMDLISNNEFNKIENIKDNEQEKNEDDNNYNIIPVNIKSHISSDLYKNIFFNKTNNTYICNLCKIEYTHINNLRRHLLKGTCSKRQETSLILNKNKERLNKIIEKENKKEETINQQINYNNCNFLNNNNNNTHNSTYNLSIRDFVHDKYDISHIKDEYYLQKDFFLYHNLLKTIMQNKNNQNIFFSNNEAIFYTDNELNKMSSDKAGYMILEKLSQSFDQIFYKNDEETQKYYEFIQKYFRIMKGQYINDTIYKEYDIDQQKFIYTSNSRLFRSRDKYLAKMVSTLGPINNDVREHMSVSLDQINNIPMINPNIENFASIKMRYRDLKDKD